MQRAIENVTAAEEDFFTADDNDQKIIYIPVDELHPHPDNPRKNIGDVTELAESIKKQGLLQNLTVVPGYKDADGEYHREEYTVLIGHRRLSAAKLAGLDELPCAVCEMDKKTQLSVMLLENMQRCDLTIYEQAKSFQQLQFDFSMSVKDISELSGFSESTIRHRIKLLDLDEDMFRQSQKYNPTISDYIELEKIEYPDLKNMALEKIGTPDFKYRVADCINKSKTRKARTEWEKVAESVATKLEKSPTEYGSEATHIRVKHFYTSCTMSSNDKEQIGMLVSEYVEDKGKTLYFYIDHWNSLYFYVEKDKEEMEEVYKNKLERENQDALIKALSEKFKIARSTRLQFVEKYTGKIEDLKIILPFLLSYYEGFDLEEEKIFPLLSLPVSDIDYEEDEDDELYIPFMSDVMSLIESHPQKVALAAFVSTYDTDTMKSYDYRGNFMKNKELEKYYEMLELIGYVISEEEKQLLDGTHAIYQKAHGTLAE